MTALKPHAREVVDYLRSVGAEAVRVQHGGKHMRAVFTWRGRELFYPLPGQWGPYSVVEAVSDLRRLLSLTPDQKRIGARRQRRALVICRALAPTTPAIVIDFPPDWHQAVAEHPASVAMIRERIDLAWVAWWREIVARHGGRSML